MQAVVIRAGTDIFYIIFTFAAIIMAICDYQAEELKPPEVFFWEKQPYRGRRAYCFLFYLRKGDA